MYKIDSERLTAYCNPVSTTFLKTTPNVIRKSLNFGKPTYENSISIPASSPEHALGFSSFDDNVHTVICS